MIRFKCEKCGYRRARLKLCGKCGRTNPCPVKKKLLQIGLGLAAVVIILCGVASARWVAEMRKQKILAETASFTAPREPRAQGSGGKGGGRRGGALSWR